MTISSTYKPVRYPASGVGPYQFDFEVVNETDVSVKVGAVFFPDTEYTVVLNPRIDFTSPGGTVTFNVAPANNITIEIGRFTVRTQGVDYQPYASFPAETHEFALDKLTMMAQETDEEIATALLSQDIFLQGLWSPVLDGPTPPDTGDELNGQYFVFNDDGNMDLKENGNEVIHSVLVTKNDEMLYLDETGAQSAGWYYLEQTVDVTAKVDRIGDTMSGPLVLPADPLQPLEAATKQYIDDQIANIVADTINANTITAGDLTVSGTTVVPSVEGAFFTQNGYRNLCFVSFSVNASGILGGWGIGVTWTTLGTTNGFLTIPAGMGMDINNMIYNAVGNNIIASDLFISNVSNTRIDISSAGANTFVTFELWSI